MTKYQGPQADQVQKMFSQVAQGYDRANTVLSAGVHHLWRKKMVAWSQVRPGQSVLDCATGTGDLALEFKNVVGSQGRVVGTDFCREMLEFAPAKARAKNLDVHFEVADVTRLPFADREFDLSSISFGIRNVEDPVKGLSEMARVVKPGGYVLVLEFGQVGIPVLSEMYNWYSSTVLPRIGGWITGRPEAYQYLQNSSAKFPCREEFVAMMNSTGAFQKIEYRPLTGGIAYMYRGLVL